MCVCVLSLIQLLFLSQQNRFALRFYAFILKPPSPHVVCRGHIKLEIRLHMPGERRRSTVECGYVFCCDDVQRVWVYVSARTQQAAIEIKKLFFAIHFISYRPWVSQLVLILNDVLMTVRSLSLGVCVVSHSWLVKMTSTFACSHLLNEKIPNRTRCTNIFRDETSFLSTICRWIIRSHFTKSVRTHSCSLIHTNKAPNKYILAFRRLILGTFSLQHKNFTL